MTNEQRELTGKLARYATLSQLTNSELCHSILSALVNLVDTAIERGPAFYDEAKYQEQREKLIVDFILSHQ